MATYSIAEAKDQLSKLVRQAEEGEDVAITRHGENAVDIIRRMRDGERE
jgi:prevent-host-death family protein